MTDDIWESVRQALKAKVGQNNYVTWIEPLEFSGLNEGIMTFRVQSNFMGNWVDRYFGDAILRAVGDAGCDARRLAFVVGKPAVAEAVTSKDGRASIPPQAAQHLISQKIARGSSAPATPVRPARDALAAGLPLDSSQTFDTFVVGKPNELAHAAARRVADGGPVAFNPLFLYGGVGLGKTHLMHAIAWEIQARDPGARVLYLSAETFMYKFVQALRDKDMMSFKQMFRSVDVLMVDDVKFIAGKDSTQEEFFHTFNALVEQKKQIVLSSDAAPGDIDGLEKRIVSRLNSGLVVDIHPTSYELRLGILQRKSELFAEQFPGARIGEGVLEFLAHRISSNVRELEGALTRLFAHSSFLGRVVELDMAQDYLRDMLKSADRRVSIDEIQRVVADHFSIKLSDLVGSNRRRIFARPRQVAMFLAKEMTDRSLPEIARKFGGRDHTTIMYGIRRIQELSSSDSGIAEDLDLLRRLLNRR